LKPTHRKKKQRHPKQDLDTALARAVAHHRAARLSKARRAYENIIKSHPACAEARYLLGRLNCQRGHLDKAIEMLYAALQWRPDFPEAQNDLANMLSDAGRLEEAASVLSDLIAHTPQHANAHNGLGVVLKQQGDLAAAVDAFEQAIRLDPQCAGQYFNLGNTLKRLDRFDEAAEAYRRVINLDPTYVDAYRYLSAVLRRAGKLHESRAVLQQWAKQSPDDPVARHMLATFSDVDSPTRASNAYIQRVFDQFAADFDDSLNDLNYRGPQLLAAALKERLPPAGQRLEVLDAGCGTGLCGPVLRPYARHLVGVDLSAAMLGKARLQGDYDELISGELTAFLAGSANRFDLIASIDTLIYFGDLAPVLKGMTAALRDGGHLVFTCEKDDEATSTHGYHLASHGRYGHAKPYLQACLMASGLSNPKITTAIIRTEAGEAATGYVVVADKG
jgi:predicted TPR repeat methyltransferase